MTNFLDFRRHGFARALLFAACAPILQACMLFPEPEPPPPKASDVRVNLDVLFERTLEIPSTSARFEARFFNKKDNRIMLDYGMVYLNGRRMSQAAGSYYELTSYDDDNPFYFHPDSLYIFQIFLDSTKPAYICSVRTQKNRMLSYSVLVSSDTARVSWDGDTTQPLRLKYTLTRIMNDYTQTVSRSQTFPPPQTHDLRVSLEGYTEFKFDLLETVVTGTVDGAFRSGSLESMVRLTR